MPIASFPLNEVVKLAEIAQQEAAKHGTSPDIEQLWDGAFYPNGEPLDSNGLTEAEAEKHDGGFFWPDASKMDKPVPVGLLLVGDQGVYLLGNNKFEKPASQTGHIVYAKGCDPMVDVEDFYEQQGGDIRWRRWRCPCPNCGTENSPAQAIRVPQKPLYW